MSNKILMIFVKTDGTHAMFNDVYERIMNICKILKKPQCVLECAFNINSLDLQRCPS